MRFFGGIVAERRVEEVVNRWNFSAFADVTLWGDVQVVYIRILAKPEYFGPRFDLDPVLYSRRSTNNARYLKRRIGC